MSFDCQSCGGCCAYSHTWPEFLEEDTCDGIPEEMCDCETGRMKCDGDRCVALVGKVGEQVSCSIYEHRPGVCREFMPGSDGCHQVRTFFKL
ncbi:YkgJ family cysteine cluster protein [Burkholderia sp. SIMBA_062]|uniref:YkgJ family cysteine cluster protein n=1 Tax=Burkholderia sp. SIMBA_062 TaxID=3085803 RepID=UPI00397AEB00